MRLFTRIVNALEADRPEQVVDHQGGFDVGGDRAGADRVEVALHELAVAAALRVLAAPDGGDVIALERRAQLADVLGGEPGQRHRQVEPQPDPTAAVVLKLVELLVGLLAPLAGEDFQVLQRRRVDRAEAVRAIDPPGRVDQPLARDHRLRQIVAETFERAGRDAWFGGHDWGLGIRDWGLGSGAYARCCGAAVPAAWAGETPAPQIIAGQALMGGGHVRIARWIA